MSDYWTPLISAFGGTAALLLLLGFFGKAVVGLFISKDLENYKTNLATTSASKLEELKAELNYKASREMESLRHQFEMASLEHSVKFTNLHQRQADAIIEVYYRLSKVIRLARIFVDPITFGPRDQSKEFKDFATYFNEELFPFYDGNKILLPFTTCQLIESVITETKKSVVLLQGFINDLASKDQKYAQWQESFNSMERTVLPAQKSLENELRKIIGSDSPAAIKKVE